LIIKAFAAFAEFAGTEPLKLDESDKFCLETTTSKED
jgi:hypothetical protein